MKSVQLIFACHRMEKKHNENACIFQTFHLLLFIYLILLVLCEIHKVCFEIPHPSSPTPSRHPHFLCFLNERNEESSLLTLKEILCWSVVYKTN